MTKAIDIASTGRIAVVLMASFVNKLIFVTHIRNSFSW